MSERTLERREVITAGLAGLGVALVAGNAHAQQKPDPHAGHRAMPKDAVAPTPPSPALQAVIDAAAACVRDARFCLARCTDHLAAGTPLMADCQRAVMNMISVITAMADVAGYRNAPDANMKALAKTCAQFCRTCAKACEPHAQHHVECKACMDACVACAKACEAFAA